MWVLIFVVFQGATKECKETCFNLNSWLECGQTVTKYRKRGEFQYVKRKRDQVHGKCQLTIKKGSQTLSKAINDQCLKSAKNWSDQGYEIIDIKATRVCKVCQKKKACGTMPEGFEYLEKGNRYLNN